MPLTTDQNSINSALRQFNITAQDYYLEFTGNVLHMHWIADASLIASYLKGVHITLDIQIKGSWLCSIDLDSVPAGYYNCRYILETN